MQKWLCLFGVVALALGVRAGNMTNRTEGTHGPASANNQEIVPLSNAHAHNDYEHTLPLLDALGAGFCSIEADIWLVDGKLLVAHDSEKVKPERTLQALYLEPLKGRIRAKGGRVFPQVPTVTLMIDIKSEAVPTYEVLRSVLAEYREMLSEFRGTNVVTQALTVIVTGNRPIEMIAAEPVRYVALDGRLADLDGNSSANLMPLISDNWKLFFQWRGQGSLPEDERLKLKQYVERAHEQGRRIRFWGAPDKLAAWQELKAAGVDLINTDDLAGLEKFLGVKGESGK